jgi:hypothetical protein
MVQVLVLAQVNMLVRLVKLTGDLLVSEDGLIPEHAQITLVLDSYKCLQNHPLPIST